MRGRTPSMLAGGGAICLGVRDAPIGPGVDTGGADGAAADHDDGLGADPEAGPAAGQAPAWVAGADASANVGGGACSVGGSLRQSCTGSECSEIGAGIGCGGIGGGIGGRD